MANTIGWLTDTFSDLRCSEIYEMPAINGIDSPYLNAVIELTSDMNFYELTKIFKNHEADCGRTLQSKAEGIIPMDIDIIIWNGKIMRPREYSFEYFAKGYRQLAGSTKCNAPSLNER